MLTHGKCVVVILCVLAVIGRLGVYAQVDITVCTDGGTECDANANTACDVIGDLVCKCIADYIALLDNIACTYDCGAAPNLADGSADSTSLTAVTYTCNAGFELVGTDTINCQAGTGWESLTVTCQCPALTAPTDGTVNADAGPTAVGGSATYTCNPGFELVGVDTTRNCVSGTGWDGTEPTCVVRDCGALDALVDGVLILPDTIVGSIATYVCDANYQLANGDETRTCQNDGTWSGTEPECIYDCGPLASAVPLVVTHPTTILSSVATYTCNGGYVLVGTETRTCAEGGWGGDEPTCLIDCGALTAPASGAVTHPLTYEGQKASYSCDADYQLVGNAERTCLNTGLWDGSDPSCVEDCGALTDPLNGDVTYANTILNEVATYTCSATFKLVGNAMRTCETGPAWSGTEPTCTEDCGALTDPFNGLVTYADTILNEQATYSCSAGFQLSDDITRTCQADHNWSGTAPTCLPGKLGDDCSVKTDLCDEIDFGACASGTCTCLNGYQDEGTTFNCSEIDECLTSPCDNGGVCTDQIADYSCECATGWSGKNCDVNPDDCSPNPCQNGGACTDGLATYTCACVAGFEGVDCEINIDECVGNVCENGATCVDGINEYTCTCAAGYEGPLCEIDIDECVGVTCKNGGTCEDGVNMFTCDCVTGFEGTNCGTNIDECSPNPCQNSGTCVDGVNAFTCECVDGFSGAFCQLDNNDCVSHGCLNGAACVDEPGGYSCTCVAGYSGNFCETNNDDCSPDPCQNSGACADGINTYTCTCISGYTGTNCETNINDCSPNPCENGACTDLVFDFTCACTVGYTGKTCNVDINDCLPPPCKHGGTCTDIVDGYYCTCDDGYEGDTCETNIDECLSNLCKNGATCKDQVNSYICQCVDGYDGTYCEQNINECLANSCQNGALCVDQINGYVCICLDGYTGTYCQTDINECSPNPCQNGGSCTDRVNSYECSCTDGHTGDTCRTSLLGDTCSEDPGICANIVFGECSGTECVCQSGYYKTGPVTCSPVDCGTLAPPDNGAVDHTDGTTYTKIALFTCITGYARSGVASVTCQNDGSWSGTAPVCEEVNECGSNPCKNGGTCNDMLNGYTCTCLSGFGGTLCVQDCGVPASTENGAVTYPDGTLVGATATYACTGGYTLSGSANSDCQTDGTWSDHGVCFVVGVIYNGICHVTAQCATTHATCRNDGLSSLRCLCAASGEFYDPDIDACLLDCGALTSPTNGEVVNPSVTAVGQVATYACFVGYGLVGSKVRTCQSNGAWSGSAPICVFGCEEPVIPANGRVNTTEGLAVGHTIYYSCVDGYELVGQEERICEASSTWSGTAPTCLIKCPIIGNIENGKVDMSWGRHEGSLATFACNTNYALVGDPIITCEDTGVWGGIQPTCVFAMFPDIILAFGAILILLIIVDIFVVGICLYYRYYRAPEKTPTSSGVKREYPDVFEEDGVRGAPPRESVMPANIRRQKFAKVMPDNGGFHPPPARPEEPNVVYRSTMKMNDTVLGNIFSKGSKYRRPEDEERTPYLDDEQMNDNGYGTAGSHSLELSRSDDFDKHLEVTHSTPGPGGKSPRETRKTIVEEPEIVEQEEDEEDRFRFRMRAPPANITESLFNDKDMLPSDRRAKSAMPVYKKKYY
ncbi:neurogenic locus notch homolog protein 2-like isoform X3 [Mya arenaria]|uniref:neurogenic locus notch homolog protein 2-like isoform X3 n=1 Tax=Mya arenaria TaxID=6604 RepID=UPI0022E4FA27|nr:neurogenic locus notch homolog protein 2-like isoform X3 [Mya arenaria]